MKLFRWLFGRKKKNLPAQSEGRKDEVEVEHEVEIEDEVKKTSKKDRYENHNSEYTNHDQMSNDNTRVYETINELPIEFLYIDQLIHHRLDKYFTAKQDTPHPGSPNPSSWRKAFADFVGLHSLNDDEATLLLIGLLPHIHPGLFDAAFESRLPESAD